MPVLKFRNRARKNFDKIVLLGETCETGWQYTRCIGDPESNLFNWVRVDNKERFLKALQNPEIAIKGDVEYKYSWGMFLDYNSGCVYHATKSAKTLNNPDGTPIDFLWEEEFLKLKERSHYMAGKLKDIYASSDSKLFVYKAQECNGSTREDYFQYFKLLYSVLDEQNSSNFNLLLIVLESDLKFFEPLLDCCPSLYLRSLEKFTPQNKAVIEEFSDNAGWKRIWQEFQPNVILKKGKVYKFSSKQVDSSSFLKKVFSVNNEKNHKVVCLLGLKMKFKLKGKNK